MNLIDIKYRHLLEEILIGEEGYSYPDVKRDNIICHQINSFEIKHDMRIGFPLLQIKKLHLKNIFEELIWFLKGDNDIINLNAKGCKIWNDDVRNFANNTFIRKYGNDPSPYSKEDYEKYIKGVIDDDLPYNIEDFSAGDIYGTKWRNWTGVSIDGDIERVDQLDHVINTIKKAPINRRSIINAWDAVSVQAHNSALPPCHWAFEILPYVKKDGTYGFDLKWHQRSVDTFLGLPYNIASYGLLMLILEKILGMTPRFLIGDLSNVHIYDNHVEQCKTLIGRRLYPNLTQVKINKEFDCLIEACYLEFKDLEVTDYNPQGFVKAEMLSISNPDWDK